MRCNIKFKILKHYDKYAVLLQATSISKIIWSSSAKYRFYSVPGLMTVLKGRMLLFEKENNKIQMRMWRWFGCCGSVLSTRIHAKFEVCKWVWRLAQKN